MANWPLNTDVVQVLLRMPALPDAGEHFFELVEGDHKTSNGK